jgi:NADP-dependent 3-hydroxy acid dehydrogenase YdfG/acyl carrier protein
VRAFPAAKTAAALRTLAQGRQIGKVVVSVHGREQPAVHHEQLPAQFEPEATYLITGGLGGIGRAAAAWMIERGAKHLVLLGRGPASEAGQQAIEDLRSKGGEVVFARGDVTQTDQLASVLDSIRSTMPPLRGVVHAAGILDDGILARLDDRRLREVMAPKLEGAWNLHVLTRDAQLDFFVLFSSAAALLGSPGQAHYAAGNAFLDALAWHRRAEGRPALSINWGPWAQVGLASGPEQQRHLHRHGMTPMAVADGVRTLSRLFWSSATQVAVLRRDPSTWRSEQRTGTHPSLIADLLGAPVASDADDRHVNLRDALLRADENERRTQIESYLREQAAGKLGLAPSNLDVESPLHQLGVDSLVAVELRAQIERDLGIVVPVVRLLDGASVTGLAGWLVEQLSGSTGEPDPVETDDAPTTRVNGTNGADPQWMDVLGRLPDISDDDVDALLRDVLAAREGQDD